MVLAADKNSSILAAKKGDIALILPVGSFTRPFTAISDIQPFVGLQVDGDVDVAYVVEWVHQIDWQIQASDNKIDKHTIRAFAPTGEYADSGPGKVTRELVESDLSNWGAAITQELDNEIIFELDIINVLNSRGYLRTDTKNLSFQEISYDTRLGIHTVEVNHSLSLTKSFNIVDRLEDRNATIESKNSISKIIQYSVGRDAVLNSLKSDLQKQIGDVRVRNRKYYIDEVMVDQAAASSKGFIAISAAQFASAIKNRIDE